MSGETEAQVSGWTVDTLHSHLVQLISNAIKFSDTRNQLLQEEMDRRLHNMQRAIDDRRTDLRESLTGSIADMRNMLDERYATQTKALDAAFLAQQTAMRTALEAAEKAVATALTSAEKAVAKAEVAADKRFESVNEFRQQLSDQTATFPSRREIDTRLEAVGAQVEANRQRVSDLELRLTSRLDVNQGKDAGTTDSRAERRLDTGQIIAAAAGFLLLISVIVNVIVTLRS